MKTQNVIANTDGIHRNYLADPEVFAQAVSQTVFGRENQVMPENVIELDSSRQFPEERIRNGKKEKTLRELRRDVLKEVRTEQEKNAFSCLIAGMEAQTYRCREMAFRGAQYDLAEYGIQIRAMERRNRKRRRKEKQESGLFLSKMKEDDLLKFACTIVVWFSAAPWKEPRNLIDLIDVPKGCRLPLPSWPLTVIEPCLMSDEELLKLGKSLGSVLILVKHSKSCEEMNQVMRKYAQIYGNYGKRETEVVESALYLNLDLKDCETKEGGFDMCKAFEQQRAFGRQEGRLEQAYESSLRLYKRGFSAEEIAVIEDQPEETVRKWIFEKKPLN